MKNLTAQFLAIVLFSMQIHAMEVVGLFSNTLNTVVRLYDTNNNFYRTVEPNEQVPLKFNTFTVKIPYGKKITSSNNDHYFYSWTYNDADGDDRLFTYTQIQYWNNPSSVFDVATGIPRPQGPDIVKFLKKRLAQIEAYNAKLID
jgi:hypothetical protein